MDYDKPSIWEKIKSKALPPKITAVANSSLFILNSSFLIACSGGTVFHSYKPLPVEGWERCDTVCFDLPRQTENISGTLTIGLRTKANIGIQDIVFAVKQCTGNAEVLRCDTVRCPLTDADGNALTGGVNIHQYETKQLPFHLQKGKRGTVRIHHLMSREDISGITEVGIKIDKAL